MKDLDANIHNVPHGIEKGNFITEGVQLTIEKLQFRMMIVLSVFSFCILIILIFFVRNIVKPLNEIMVVTKQMIDGRLDQTVPVRDHDEIGRIASFINDLSANLQEIFLGIMKRVENSNRILEHLHEKIRSETDSKIANRLAEDIKQLQRDNEEMDAMVNHFDFYDIHNDSGKLYSRTDLEKNN